VSTLVTNGRSVKISIRLRGRRSAAGLQAVHDEKA
jgi:hypothetical protein